MSRLHPLLSPVAVAGLLLLASACGGEPYPGAPIERWSEHPEKLEVLEAGTSSPEGALAYHWSGKEVASWRREESGGLVTLVSPELAFGSVGELDSICVSIADLRGRHRLTLHWNDEPAFTGQGALKQCRDLTTRAGSRTAVFLVRGDEIADVDLLGTAAEEKAPRHLFLRFPARPAGDVVFESIGVLSKDAALGVQMHGWTRLTVAGRVRDTLYATTPATLRYTLDLSVGGDLAFGAYHDGAGGSVELSVTVGSATEPAWSDRVPAGERWTDFRVPLAPTLQNTVTLEARNGGPGTTLFWSNPMLLRGRATNGRPNVVLYVMDALRAEQTTPYGYSRATTPCLAELATRGVLYEQAYSPVSWTKPSVTTMLTSLYPQVHGVGERSHSDALPDEVETLQDALRRAGYVTASFAANPLGSTLSNLDQGFDEAFTPNSFRIEDRKAKRDKVHSDDLNAELLPWLAAHAQDRFFAYVHTVDPHVPFAAPVVPPELAGAGAPTDAYDAEIRFNDDQLAILCSRLEELGLAENTLLIVTADHGESFGEHGTTGHGTNVHQEEVRIPLLFLHPGRLAPRKVAEPMQLIDLLPTILSHVDVPYDPAEFQGRDVLAPAFEREARPVFLSRFVYPDDMDVARFNEVEYYAVIDGAWKLIVSKREQGAGHVVELYHLGADPEERDDRSASEPERAERYLLGLKAFLDAQGERRAEFLSTHGPGVQSAAGAASAEVLEQLRQLGYVK